MAPSDRHIELQNMVNRWIGNRSFKMCALPECNVVGYVADFVAIAGMYSEYHQRYAEYSNLKKMSMSHRLKDDHKERHGNDKWIHVIHGDIDRWYVCVFEIKVSRSDFLNTFGSRTTGHAKARRKPVGTAHWVVAEKGICEPEELPEFWGLLTPCGAGLSEKKKPKLNVLPEGHLHAMAFDMLWLSMNYRWSYYKQLADMAEKISDVRNAIKNERPKAELIRRADKAVAACRGLAQ